MSKYIFITGGVVSSIGKGITAASLGRLLIERGLKVTIQNFDPYLNVDSGTMNPEQHGEVFVTEDGGETDLDLGHYERFLDINFHKDNSYTSGKIYSKVIAKERKGDYLGDTVQIVPHVTTEIKNAMRNIAEEDIDVVIVEVDGTVGDIESLAYLEAIRQFQREIKSYNYLHIHCTLVPYLESADEVKTKPTQHSVKELTSLGLNPDIIIARTSKDVEISTHIKKKIAMFCNLDNYSCVIHCPDCKSIYEVPLVLESQGLDRLVCFKLGLDGTTQDLKRWRTMVDIINSDLPVVNIAIVGKYTEVKDAYLSVIESIKHSAYHNKHHAKISIISSEDVETFGAKEVLKNYDGIVVPGGFGARGSEGKIATAQYCRENKVPYIGLCLGMQIATIEFARNVAGFKDANSTEFNPYTKNPVVHLMEEQKEVTEKGGTMRLGNDNVHLVDGTLARRLYGLPNIEERHRHRYCFNTVYKEHFEKLGLVFSGINEEKNIIEIVEIKDHPFYMAGQFHPEFKSRPYKPHPMFMGFMTGVISNLKKPTINN